MHSQFPGKKKYCIEVIKRQDGSVQVDGLSGCKSPIEMFGSTGQADHDVTWQISESHFSITTDFLSLFQIYYTQLPDGRVLLSNYIDELINKGADTALDDGAMAVFIRLGYFLADDTPFKHIKVLPPNSTITVDKAGLSIDIKPKHLIKASPELSYDQAVKQYGDIFQSSVEAVLNLHPDHDIVVPISGGMDSRHILFAVEAAGKQPQHLITCNRFRPNMDADVDVAKQVCEAMGLEQQLLSQNFSDLVTQELDNFSLNSYCADENNWALPLADYFEALDRPFVSLDGLAGDVLTANAWNDTAKLALYREEKLEQLADRILKDEGHQIDCLSEFGHQRWNVALAKEKIIEELSQYVGTCHPLGHFYLWNRAIREIGHIPRTWQGRFGIVSTPYLVKPMYDFLTSLPGEYGCGKAFHGDVIAKTYPKYADIPYAKNVGFRKADFFKRIKLVKDAWYYLNTGTGSDFVDYGYLKPRLIKGLVDAKYGTSLHSSLVLPLYLTKLAKIGKS